MEPTVKVRMMPGFDRGLNLGAGCLALVGCLLASGVISLSASAAPRGPRAIGVITWHKADKGVLLPTLTPIAIFYDGEIFDANLYRASPVPLALEPETVYEGQRGGKPVGFFTIRGAQVENGSWYAGGKWQLATPESSSAKRPRPIFAPGEADDANPPRLKRSPSSNPSQENPGATGPAAPERSKENHPKDDEAVKSKNTSPPSRTVTALPIIDDDPDRPTLRRGKPTGPRSDPPPTTPDSGGSKGRLAAGETETLVAVSDAGPYDARSYVYPLKPEEGMRLQRAMELLVRGEIAKYLRTRPASGNLGLPAPPIPSLGRRERASRNRRSRALPQSQPQHSSKTRQVPLSDIKFHAFDLATTNDAVLVFTARQAATAVTSRGADEAGGGGDVFITLIARVDVDGNPHSIFSLVSDKNHLDIFPRLELIDAVDATGNGRGDLLFRADTADGALYVIYKVGRDEVRKLFEGGGR